MAIRGDLKDMSLMNLLQFVSQGRQNNAIYMVREGVEGVIYFQDGDPMHATVGSLVGNEAVYQLLNWTEGTFEVSEIETIPRQTINTTWNHLVLEEMRRSAERRRNGGEAEIKVISVNNLKPEEIDQDNNLENQVILLLSKLEHTYTNLCEAQKKDKPAAAIETLTEMVNLLADFALDQLYIDVLSDIVSMVTGGHSATDILQVKDNRLLNPKLVLSAQDDPDKLAGMMFQVVESLMRIIEKFFILITNSFHSSSMGDKWTVTTREFTNVVSDEVKAAFKTHAI